MVPVGHCSYTTGVFSCTNFYSSSDSGVYKRETGSVYGFELNATPTITVTNVSAGAHTHTVTTNASTSGAVGNSSPSTFSNLQPYTTTYIYKRIS